MILKLILAWFNSNAKCGMYSQSMSMGHYRSSRIIRLPDEYCSNQLRSYGAGIYGYEPKGKSWTLNPLRGAGYYIRAYAG